MVKLLTNLFTCKQFLCFAQTCLMIISVTRGKWDYTNWLVQFPLYW